MIEKSLHGKVYVSLEDWLYRNPVENIVGERLILSGTSMPDPRWIALEIPGRPSSPLEIGSEDLTERGRFRRVSYKGHEIFCVPHNTRTPMMTSDTLLRNSTGLRYLESIWVEVGGLDDRGYVSSVTLRVADTDATTPEAALAHIERIAVLFDLPGVGYQSSGKAGGIDD